MNGIFVLFSQIKHSIQSSENAIHKMTEEEKQHDRDEFSSKSVGQLSSELLRLILVLTWRILVWLFKKLLKGVLWFMQACEDGWIRLNNWWHDNDTQEKVAKTKAWIKQAARTFAQWCVIAAKATAHGIVVGSLFTWKCIKIGAKITLRGIILAAKATAHGITHLRPTLKKLVQLIIQGFKSFVLWLKHCKRSMRYSHIMRRRRYQTFRRNGGIKGWMANTSKNMQKSIVMFMEEDQDEATPEAVTEDDIMEEAMEEGANNGKKSMKFGKTFMSHAKNFMDVE